MASVTIGTENLILTSLNFNIYIWLVATVLASTVLELPREGLTNRYSGYCSQMSNSISMDYSPKEENLKRVDGGQLLVP